MGSAKKWNSSNRKKLSRRSFIGSSIAVLAGAGLPTSAKLMGASRSPEGNEVKIQEFRTLGRTGFKVSDIGFGTGELVDSALLEAILDSGVNYLDCAESYGRGRAERIIGTVLKKRAGDRKKTFVTTKLALRENDTKETIMERVHKCLERLQTGYVDCLMIHAPATVERLKNKAFFAAFNELKSQGKARFCGVSNHGPQWNEVPETMEKVLLAAADDGRFDAMLLVYNFLQKDQGERVLQACKEKNIGATLMKTNPVLNFFEMKENAEKLQAEGKEVPEYMQKMLSRLQERSDAAEAFKTKYNLTSYDAVRDAAIKFVLSNPNVSCACPTIKNFEDLEFYVGLSGKRFSSVEKRALAAYMLLMGKFYCRHACGECESYCPAQVPVNTIMRYNHYFTAQRREKSAMQKYALLPRAKADTCVNCSGFCEKACPFGVPIQGLLVLAHDTLTLA